MSKKIVALVLVCVVVFGIVVGGTLAYLQDETEVVRNTFTVGNVSIDLDEAKVDLYGEAITPAARVKVNEYKLIPGQTYTKDPTIHVANGSEECYVFVKVANGLADIEAAGETTIAKQMEANWAPLVVDENPVTNVYYYKTTVDALEEAKNLVVFNSFKLADGANVAAYEAATIEITGYAVQSDGFDTAAAAWTGANFS